MTHSKIDKDSCERAINMSMHGRKYTYLRHMLNHTLILPSKINIKKRIFIECLLCSTQEPQIQHPVAQCILLTEL